tara:strand:- start:316 stop:1083 length:768 start_codon:yes stop_codon:yes gene_type:complete
MTIEVLLKSLRKKIISFTHSKALLEKKIQKKKGVIILMYHSVTNSYKEYPYSIDKNNFEIQMRFLKNNYSFFDINNLFDNLNMNNNDRPKVCITFDDGFKDNISIVYPILKEYDIPFTIFLTTDFIKSSNKTFLDWEEIKRFSDDPLITFGAHSVLHANFTSLDINDVKNELINSKKDIEQQINKPIDYCAYPYGGYNQKIKSLTKTLFKGALIDRQPNIKYDMYSIPRISIDKNNEDYKNFLLTLILSKYITKL